jgi:hypothetical protein
LILDSLFGNFFPLNIFVQVANHYCLVSARQVIGIYRFGDKAAKLGEGRHELKDISYAVEES